MSRTQHWTPADEKTIRTMYLAGCEDCAIAERLGRTHKAVEGRRTRMGLYRVRDRTTEQQAVQRARPWADAETEMLIAACNMGWDNLRIGKLLDRSAHSVKGKREVLTGQRERQHAGSASALASIDANSGWPRACTAERKRGEKLLDRALGGKPRVDLSPMVRQWQPPKVYTHVISESSCAWAVSQ